MKKTILLAAVTLMSVFAMSCENDSITDSDGYADYGTDDGFIPVTPPPPPPPPPTKPK